MTKPPLALALTALLLAASAPADAYIVIAREPVANRVALADTIVIGKIAALRPGTVRARIYPRENNEASKFDFILADLDVREVIAGPRDLKRLTIAFVHIQATTNQYKPAPAAGLEGCFFAVKHFDEDFFVVPVGGYVDPRGAGMDAEMRLVRRCAKLLEKAADGLQSNQPGDPLLAAHLLALKYNYAPLRWFGPCVEGEALDPALSRLLLRVLAQADWSKPDEQTRASASVATGWIAAGARQAKLPWPEDFPTGQIHDAAAAAAVKKWLAANAETFRLQRLVPAKALKPATRPQKPAP